MGILILSYTIQLVIPNVCTKFQNLRCSSSWEIVDMNFPMHNIAVRDGKREKEGKMIEFSIVVFFHTIYFKPL